MSRGAHTSRGGRRLTPRLDTAAAAVLEHPSRTVSTRLGREQREGEEYAETESIGLYQC